MYAQNADHLRMLITDNPDEHPAVFLYDSSFAAACYDNKTLKELKSAFHRDADKKECGSWGLSPSEWKEQIEMALVVLETIKKRSGE